MKTDGGGLIVNWKQNPHLDRERLRRLAEIEDGCESIAVGSHTLEYESGATVDGLYQSPREAIAHYLNELNERWMSMLGRPWGL